MLLCKITLYALNTKTKCHDCQFLMKSFIQRSKNKLESALITNVYVIEIFLY